MAILSLQLARGGGSLGAVSFNLARQGHSQWRLTPSGYSLTGPWSRASAPTSSGWVGIGPGLANVYDPHQQVAYCGQATDMADVWVDGRRVAGGRLVDHDLAALVEASRPLARDLITRVGLGEFSKLAR